MVRGRTGLLGGWAAAFGVGAACGAQTDLLEAHAAPPNTALLRPAALFFDLEPVRDPVIVVGLTTGVYASTGEPFTFELLIRDGSGLGGTVMGGPGGSLDGWTDLGTVSGVQGPVNESVSLPVELPRFVVQPGHITGVALWFRDNRGPMFFNAVSGPYFVYQNDVLRLTTGDARFQPFTTAPVLFRPCALVGSIIYEVAPCYPNCDGSTIAPVLNVGDFICFQTRFAVGDSYANCDGSTAEPVLNVADFVCFLQRFAGGCS